MCGICGFWTSNSLGDNKAVLGSMTEALNHRGPDGAGQWYSRDDGVYLGHTRLAIIDLTDQGHQPMFSSSGRYVLTYNGEIYNHRELRKSLETAFSDFTWRGDSDSETLLEVIDRWGVEGALERLNGMFAFAVWDREMNKLIVARDKVGEKPLYILSQDGLVAFASELQSIRQLPEIDWKIDRNSLAYYFTQSNVPAPFSIYAAVQKLEAGEWMEFISPRGNEQNRKRYWSFCGVVEAGKAQLNEYELEINEIEWRRRLKSQLQKSVSSRMHSDVPLGCFLSGGVDSSLVASIMQEASDKPVKTFSIGFEESSFDESPYAQAVASHIGSEHVEFTVTASDAIALVPKLPEIWDEPFADSSQIPTFLVSQLTKGYVTVALSGDGGDEVFGGYQRYLQAHDLWNRIGHIPLWFRRGLTSATKAFEQFGNGAHVPEKLRIKLFRLSQLSDMIISKSEDEMYLAMRRHWNSPEELVLGAGPLNFQTELCAVDQNFTERMMLHDSIGYLPNDILTKVDRATMASGLESRAPLLDVDLIEFAWQIPHELKVKDRVGKYLLRQVLYEYVPRNLVDRPKAGFAVPLGQWLKGPLREWAEDLLHPDLIRRQGYLNPDLVSKAWSDHKSGFWDGRYRLWDVLMFQAWLCNQVSE